VVGATLSGTGQLVKSGDAIVLLTGNNNFTGATTVNGGSLIVNGSIASSSLTTVNSGATLGGNGTVGNTTINGGALAPGNSIGLLTVQGNLVFTAASSYMVEISPSNADRTNATGNSRQRDRECKFCGGDVCRQAVHHPERGRRREWHIQRTGQHQSAGRIQVEPELRRQ
jgi:autotransporter-associated beta strand protein